MTKRMLFPLLSFLALVTATLVSPKPAYAFDEACNDKACVEDGSGGGTCKLTEQGPRSNCSGEGTTCTWGKCNAT